MTNLLGKMYDSLVRTPLERRRRIRAMFDGLPSRAELRLFRMEILVRCDPGPHPQRHRNPGGEDLDTDRPMVHVKVVDRVTGDVIARRDSVYAWNILSRYLDQIPARELLLALTGVEQEGLCCWADETYRYPCTPEDDCWYGVDAIERPTDDGDSSAGSSSP